MSTICRIFNLVQEIELCQNRPIIALKRSLFIFKYIYIYTYGIRLIQVVNIKPVLRCFNCSFTACHIVATSTYGPLLSFLPRLKQRFGPHGQGSRYCFPGQTCSGCWLIGIPGPSSFSPSIAI